LKKSIDLYRQAIAADPNYALAYTGLAGTYLIAPSYGIGIGAKEAMVKADEASQKALELDPSLEEARSTRAGYLAYTRQWTESEAEFKKAFAMNPNNASAHYFYANTVLLPLGRIDECLEHYRIALSLDPLSPIVNMNYAVALESAHRYDEAQAQFKKLEEREPNFQPPHFYYSQFLAVRGKFAEAIPELAKFTGPWIQLPPSQSFSPDANGYNKMLLAGEKADISTYHDDLAVSYALLGERDKALEHLAKAVDVDPELPAEIRSPAFDLLRSDPRFKKILSDLHLPD
jgi:tetratricopeptide (TPR) repeat protein